MTDTVMVELPREVARAFVKHERGVTPEQSRRERTPFWIDEWTAVVKVDPRVPEACREALTNPTRSDESELRLAAEEVVGFAGIMTALTPEKERREIPTTFNTMLGTFGELLDNLAATLSQTPEAEQKEIPDERICPGCKGTGVRDANHGMCRACNGYGKFQDPPPTATGEGSQSVSEGVDGERFTVEDVSASSNRRFAVQKITDTQTGETFHTAGHDDNAWLIAAKMTKLAANHPSPEEGVQPER